MAKKYLLLKDLYVNTSYIFKFVEPPTTIHVPVLVKEGAIFIEEDSPRDALSENYTCYSPCAGSSEFGIEEDGLKLSVGEKTISNEDFFREIKEDS